MDHTRARPCDRVRVIELERLVKILRSVAAVWMIVGFGALQSALAQDAPAAPAESPAPEEPEVSTSDFNRELLTIEENVNTLKERVFRSKATLQLLKEIVVQGSSSGSRGAIWHLNKLGRGYTIESVAYYLDGQGKFSKIDPSGGLDKKREFKVFDGPIPPGNHNLTVHVKLKGNGFGIFSYVKDYVFNVQATTAFVAEDGKSCKVQAVVNERSGIGRSFTERPYVKFETRCIRLAEEAPEGN